MKYLYSKYKTDKEKGKVNKEWQAKALKNFAKQQGKLVDQTIDRSNSFPERFQEFLDANDFNEGRINQYRVIIVMDRTSFPYGSPRHRRNRLALVIII